MDLTPRLRNARAAMQLAQLQLEDYVNNRPPNAAEFERLFEAVTAATSEYARVVRDELEQKYKTVIDGSLQSEPQPS